MSMDKKYDYVIVGGGLFGAICAHELNKKGKSVVVLELRDHIGGNCYTEEKDGVHIHKYGAHIFHTNDKKVWDYINQFAEFRPFSHNVIANYKGEIYNLPFNMSTFNQMWGVTTPYAAENKIDKQRFKGKVTNLEEQALSLVGKDVYEKLIKGYTQKQWRKDPKELPASIIKRLPVRFTYNNNYFNDKYQGIPIGGYTQIFDKLLDGIKVYTNCNYLENKEYWDNLTDKVIYTGPIDTYFNYEFGDLEYKSVEWETMKINTDNYQGCAVMNYTDEETSFTRIIEHKHFDDQNQKVSWVSIEYPKEYKRGTEPFYPVNDEANNDKYRKYKQLADNEAVIFGGRLAEYKYYDMHQVVASALTKVNKL
jgi:UDP-galactopyranose mutase|tara:strand:- start:919 stop:2013 length:1095 start_codon:yes stop_codon:yes gene_type:complete